MKHGLIALCTALSVFTASAQPGDLGMPDQEYLELRRCAESHPDSIFCLLRLAMAYPSVQDCKRALSWDEEYQGAFSFSLSQMYTSALRMDSALYYADLAYSHGIRSEAFYLHRVNLALGENDQTYIKWVDEGLRNNPRTYSLLSAKAHHLLSQGNFAEGKEVFEQAVRWAGPEGRWIIGPWIERANTFDPGYAHSMALSMLSYSEGDNDRYHIISQLGWWCLELWHSPDEAIQWFTEAMEIVDRQTEGDSIPCNGLSNDQCFSRGLAYWRLGRKEEAYRDWVWAVMWEYDENPRFETFFDEMEMNFPSDPHFPMLRWMYRQNRDHFQPEADRSFALRNHRLYETLTYDSEIAPVVQTYIARAFLINGRMKKARIHLDHAASAPLNFFFADVRRALERAESVRR